MTPRFVFVPENVPCVTEVIVNRSLKADCTDYITVNEVPAKRE